MIDSGAQGTFLDQNHAKNFETKLLDQPIIAKHVDGTINKKGTIKSYVDLEFKIGSKNFKECHWIRKTKDHSWFSLAQKTLPKDGLENWKN